jgi:hypothetical protein
MTDEDIRDMTYEDIRKTVADIRQASHDVDMVKSMLETAADELEWLKSIVQGYEQHIDRLAQSDAEPVAWRWRWISDPPDVWNFADSEFQAKHLVIEPLYTARPQPSYGNKL